MKVCMVSEMSLRSRVDDLPISIVVVRPDQEPRAVLQLAHGVCGCKERFMPLMQFMADNGVVCVAGDHRGHGDSVRDASDLGYMYEGGYMALVDDMRMGSQDLSGNSYISFRPQYGVHGCEDLYEI